MGNTFEDGVLTVTKSVETKTNMDELCRKKQHFLTSIREEKERLAAVQAEIDIAVSLGFVEPEYKDVEKSEGVEVAPAEEVK